MAKNTNKRIAVKWIRDKAKAAYQKQNNCCICDTTEDLELHHVYSITRLLEQWAKQNNFDISTDEGVLAVRDQFIDEHHHELYDLVYTLCNKHHVALHSVYGKAPPFGSEMKQKRWIELQQQKQSSGDREIPKSSYGSFFSEFTK